MIKKKKERERCLWRMMWNIIYETIFVTIKINECDVEYLCQEDMTEMFSP